MKSYIICLSKIESSLKTATATKQQLEELGMEAELFEGTYGPDAVRQMEREGRILHPVGLKGPLDANDPKINKLMSPGVKGCFYSHFRLWQKCIELNEPIIIFEDDIMIRRPFLETDWNDILIVALGHPTKSERFMPQLETPYGDPRALIYKLASMPGCCGYAIKPHAAKVLVNTYKNSFLPADNAINRNVETMQIHSHIMGIAMLKKDGKRSLTKLGAWGEDV